MKDGFVKVAAATPAIRVADCAFNAQSAAQSAKDAAKAGARLLVLPELCITGYTCGDLFFQQVLLEGAMAGLSILCRETAALDMVILAGLPVRCNGKLYNCAAVLHRGRVLAYIPKTFLPNYGEFYERRQFTAAFSGVAQALGPDGAPVPMGTDILFHCRQMPGFVLAAEICEDLWAPCPPSTRHACAGATVIANLSASDETVGKDRYRRELVAGQSARLVCGYLYADAGEGESTTDMVFAGHNLIAENGVLLAQTRRYSNDVAVTELDVDRLTGERRRLTTFPPLSDDGYLHIEFSLEPRETVLTRPVASLPFIPAGREAREGCCENILQIQSCGLKKRLAHSRAKTAVIGISGGLDSALALLVAVRALDLLERPRTDAVAVTMPCFGTTRRTRGNAEILAERLGVTLRTIDIKGAVDGHFTDIGHDTGLHDVTYENAQARERTQVLMDVANQTGGLVIGTGDLSELALGWATYNGDHMSMYGVNASIPKTLVRHLVSYEADISDDDKLRDVLRDILDTPVSPELLPPEQGEIFQKTEDLVGPYELHDFFLYYLVRWSFPPRKVFRLAQRAFPDCDAETILKWLRTFCRRFFQQQFKRSCLPDGPKVGSVSLSPRGDWRMPSDAVAALWLDDLDGILP